MIKISLILYALTLSIATHNNPGKEPRIMVEKDETNKKVDVIIDGELFTSYIWPDNIKKPVLYPLKTSKGTIITRGFPIEPRVGERTDHPHHIGHWFNYGDVNGLDFWNNSYAIAEEKKARYGSIKHQKIISAKGGEKEGILEVETKWINSEGAVLLVEITRFVFSGDDSYRFIERNTKLTAPNEKVNFKDNKEGMIAIRMDRAFEFPTEKPFSFIDEDGKPTKEKTVNNVGVSGAYLSSEGAEGDKVWGSRAKWVRLSGNKDGENISVTIIDHPKNPGYPTYWHARTYGLFAANPLGEAVFTKGEKQLNFSLDKGESVTFKYKIAIKSGSEATEDELNNLFDGFSEK